MWNNKFSSLVVRGPGSPIVKSSIEKIEAADDAKKTVSYAIIDGDLLQYYKKFRGQISVTPNGDGSEVKWSAEYEKAHHEVPDPTIIKDFAVKNFLEVDDHIQKA